MNPFVALIVTLALISSFSLLGALAAYHALPKVKANQKVWQLFASYLMLLLSLDLLLVSFIRRIITELPLTLVLKGFIAGLVITFLFMQLYTFIKSREDQKNNPAHNHTGNSLSIILFLILAIHELSEGASVAEIFYEVSVNSISISASLMPIIILALHEFPEGLLLVTPFFIAKKIKTGIYASLINQILFILSGIIIYRFVLIAYAPSIATQTFMHTLPAGGIFYLGLHELKNALEHRQDLKLFYSNMALKIICLVALVGVLGSLFFVYEHTQREKEGILDVSLCEKGIDLEYCLPH